MVGNDFILYSIIYIILSLGTSLTQLSSRMCTSIAFINCEHESMVTPEVGFINNNVIIHFEVTWPNTRPFWPLQFISYSGGGPSQVSPWILSRSRESVLWKNRKYKSIVFFSQTDGVNSSIPYTSHTLPRIMAMWSNFQRKQHIVVPIICPNYDLFWTPR